VCANPTVHGGPSAVDGGDSGDTQCSGSTGIQSTTTNATQCNVSTGTLSNTTQWPVNLPVNLLQQLTTYLQQATQSWGAPDNANVQPPPASIQPPQPTVGYLRHVSQPQHHFHQSQI